VYRVLDKLELPRGFPDFTTVSYANGTVFNVARTLALAQRYLSADILVQLSLEPDPAARTASLYVSSVRKRTRTRRSLGSIETFRSFRDRNENDEPNALLHRPACSFETVSPVSTPSAIG